MNITIPQIKRMGDLAGAGLSDGAIAAVMNLDYGLEMSLNAARYYRRRYAFGPRTVQAPCKLTSSMQGNWGRASEGAV